VQFNYSYTDEMTLFYPLILRKTSSPIAHYSTITHLYFGSSEKHYVYLDEVYFYKNKNMLICLYFDLIKNI
jgi:hypothetical protein